MTLPIGDNALSRMSQKTKYCPPVGVTPCSEQTMGPRVGVEHSRDSLLSPLSLGPGRLGGPGQSVTMHCADCLTNEVLPTGGGMGRPLQTKGPPVGVENADDSLLSSLSRLGGPGRALIRGDNALSSMFQKRSTAHRWGYIPPRNKQKGHRWGSETVETMQHCPWQGRARADYGRLVCPDRKAEPRSITYAAYIPGTRQGPDRLRMLLISRALGRVSGDYVCCLYSGHSAGPRSIRGAAYGLAAGPSSKTRSCDGYIRDDNAFVGLVS